MTHIDLERKIKDIKPLSALFEGLKADFKTRIGKPGLPTGIDELDAVLWGVHRQQVLCIASRPSEGKTTLGMQLAWNLADTGKSVYFISLEMSRHQLVERLLCNLMSIRNTDLRSGAITAETHTKIGLFEKLLRESKPKLTITDNIGYDYTEIEQVIKHLSSKPDIIILDYIQLCSLGRHGSRVESISEYVRALKQLSVEMDAAVILLSQINRGVRERSDRRPLLEELKGSGTLEEHCDTVALLYWVSRNEGDCADPTEYEVNIAKQRHGPTMTVKLKFLPQFYRIESRPVSPESRR